MQKTANRRQGIVRDERGQNEPADAQRAQRTSSRRQHGQSDPPMATDDDVTPGHEAKMRREKMRRQDEAEGDS
jgi:hypothetical protein